MTKEDLENQWILLRMDDFARLGKAREQVHQGLQLVAAVGRSYLPAIKSDEFANLEWIREVGMYAARLVGGRWQFKVALRPSDLSLHILSPQNRLLNEFSLDGTTQEEAEEWLKREIQIMDLDPSTLDTKLPYSIPEYDTAKGAAFDGSDRDALAELAVHFQNASLFLEHVASIHTLALPVRIWPHHFDMATRRRFMGPKGPWHMGIAFSPGDAHNYSQPHYLLTRYPKDSLAEGTLPKLGQGPEWHTERWLGVVVQASYIVRGTSVIEQVARISRLIDPGMVELAKLGGFDRISPSLLDSKEIIL